KNVVSAPQPVVTIDRKFGYAMQIRVDASVEGIPPSNLSDFELRMVIRRAGDIIFERTFSDYYIKPRVIRAAIVEHMCEDLDIEVSMGSQRREVALKLWCGD